MITTKQFNNMVAKRSGISQANVKKVIEAFESVLYEIIRDGESVRPVNGVIFGVRERAARTMRDPRNGSPIEVPATNVPFVKLGKAIKDAAKG